MLLTKAPGRESPTGSSSRLDLEMYEEGPPGARGSKPSLAERNRERQQRFRQRQKTRIEELESRVMKLTQQAKLLTEEKEEMAKNNALLKDLVQVRELQIVAVTSRLAQLSPNAGEIKDLPSVDASVEALLQAQQQSAPLQLAPQDISGQAAQVNGSQNQDHAANSATAVPSASLPQSSPDPVTRPKSPAALDQLCRVAEIAERQGGGSSSSDPQKLEEKDISGAPWIFASLSEGFDRSTDVAIFYGGQRVCLHSALLAAHSNYYAKKFEELRHSQPLYPSTREPLVVDMASPGKRSQEIEAFLRHCYGCLDVRRVQNDDLMRLIMLADELGAKKLIHALDDSLLQRSEGKDFSFFVELTNGGDMVDWIRLSDQLGLKKTCHVCELHLARHLKENSSGQESGRMHELGQESLLRVINKLAQL